MGDTMRALLVALLFLALAACGGATVTPEQQRLDRTFQFAKQTMTAVGRDELAAMSYQSLLEMGGTPTDYLAASAPDDADFSELIWDGPAKPWSVVLREGPGPDDFIIDAYAADVAKPARSETVTARPLPKP